MVEDFTLSPEQAKQLTELFEAIEILDSGSYYACTNNCLVDGGYCYCSDRAVRPNDLSRVTDLVLAIREWLK